MVCWFEGHPGFAGTNDKFGYTDLFKIKDNLFAAKFLFGFSCSNKKELTII
jgi:hypothetical protein